MFDRDLHMPVYYCSVTNTGYTTKNRQVLQHANKCSNSTVKTVGKGIKYIQS